MELIINDHRKIHAIQEEFTKLFPFLHLEFFLKPHDMNGPSPKKEMLNNTKTLGECRTVHSKGGMSIAPGMSVAGLEELFRDRYGLFVQVMRRSGDHWLETTATDHWTLAQQNAQGEIMSKPVVREKENEDLDPPR
ncbi:MAG TPA: hypothetical protein VI112_16350 [Bacteroidia bacterium]|jgi:glycerol-3-phosphate O-acyltransferase